MCFVGFSSEFAVAESVTLFTHCRTVQLSERCQPRRQIRKMTTARSTGAESSEEELETCVWKAKQVVYARAQEQTLK